MHKSEHERRENLVEILLNYLNNHRTQKQMIDPICTDDGLIFLVQHAKKLSKLEQLLFIKLIWNNHYGFVALD